MSAPADLPPATAHRAGGVDRDAPHEGGNSLLERRYDRRQVLKAGLMGSGLLLFGGCGSSGGSSSKRTITVVRGSDISTLDATKARSATDLAVIRNIVEPLMRSRPGKESDLAPLLAKSWRSVSDTKWRFELRDGVKFTDGSRFDAETVKWTLERLAQPSNVSAGRFDAIDRVEIRSPTVVDIITKYPSGSLPQVLHSYGVMLDPKWMESGEYSPDKQIGTGPGVFKHWKKGQEVALDVNPAYPRKPNYAGIVFKPISDAQTRANTVLSGDADIVMNILPQDVARLRSARGMRIKTVVGTRVASIRISDNIRPFDDKRVRQALNYATDIPAIVKSVLNGLGRPVNGQPIGDFALNWQRDLKAYPYDPERAKSLLARAGYPRGFSTKLGTSRGKDPGDYEFVRAVAGQLAKVGIDAEVVIHEPGEYLSMYSGLAKADPLFYWSSGNSVPTVENTLLDHLQECSFAVHSSKLERLYNQLRQTADPEKRAGLAREALLFMHDYAPAIWGFQIEAAFAVSDRVDFTPRQFIDYLYMDEIKLKA